MRLLVATATVNVIAFEVFVWEHSILIIIIVVNASTTIIISLVGLGAEVQIWHALILITSLL